MNQIAIDDKYLNSVAYHEAGHTVVAAVQEMPLRDLGIHIDSLGCGKAFYWERVPDGSRNNRGSDVERERTIIAASAGYVAQKQFYSDTLSEDVRRYMERCAQPDTALVIELLQEMYSGDTNAWFAARSHLFAESVRLVGEYWGAIDALAKRLLAKEWEHHRTDADADGLWSTDNREKWLHGIEVVALLKVLNVPAFIINDSIGTYSPTLKPGGVTLYVWST